MANLTSSSKVGNILPIETAAPIVHPTLSLTIGFIGKIARLAIVVQFAAPKGVNRRLFGAAKQANSR
jgi:hypothetical protein